MHLLCLYIIWHSASTAGTSHQTKDQLEATQPALGTKLVELESQVFAKTDSKAPSD